MENNKKLKCFVQSKFDDKGYCHFKVTNDNRLVSETITKRPDEMKNSLIYRYGDNIEFIEESKQF